MNLTEPIKKYCEELAKSDVDFATHYNPDKISACCNYITNQARKIIKSGCGFIEDPVVYKWARDFFYGDTEEQTESHDVTSEDEANLEEEEIETKPATVITAKKEKKSDEQYQMSLF